MAERVKVCSCGGEKRWSKSCYTMVCENCEDHDGLARCFCGWAKDGDNERQQLEEMGETIEVEDGDRWDGLS